MTTMTSFPSPLSEPAPPLAPDVALSPVEAAKRAAARRTLREVESGMTLGLGTGSTVRHFLDLLGEALAEGRLERIRGVATSRDTESRAEALGIPLVELDEVEALDLAVDGTDEFTPELDLIKGLGGALLREKMVVQAARRFVVMADGGKAVDRLGSRAPLPVEVVPFAWRSHLPFFRLLGADPRLRRGDDGEPLLTDNGNPVVDLHFDPCLPDPGELEARLRARAGVVETGLFLRVADAVVVAGVSEGHVEPVEYLEAPGRAQ